MNSKKQILIVTIILFSAFSCKDQGTNPSNTFINPREMKWTADTLLIPNGAIQLLPENLLVFSENDAWLCCWCDIRDGLMWHYDGEKWNQSNSLEE